MDGRIFGPKVMLSYDNIGMKNYNVLVATLIFFRNDKPKTFVFSHLVLASKFIMPPTAHTMKGIGSSFELKPNVLKIILNATEEVRLLG